MRSLRWWAALPVAAAGGFLLDMSTPDVAWWPAVFLGTAAITMSLWGQRAGRGALLGAVAGGAFWLPHISWLTLYLGPIPWLALSGAMIAWYAAMGAVIGWITRSLPRSPWLARHPLVLRAALSIAVSGVWVLREQLQATWPYGGFAWGRLAHALADAPMGSLASWLGFAGLSALIALIAVVPVSVVMLSNRAPGVRSLRSLFRAGAGAVGAALTVVMLGLIPAFALPVQDTVRIGAVQGNSKSGIFDDRENGDVLRDHLVATSTMLGRVEADGESLDLIVWPENSGEFQLFENRTGSAAVARLAKRADAPIVVGSVLEDPDGTYTNSAAVWGADGPLPLRYDKRRPVPFAEYMPHREVYHSIVPDLVDLVQLEYEAGERPTVLEVPLSDGRRVQAGLAICFDIIFDDQAVHMRDDGAELILAPTNNADFGHTDESAQQLQIARLRAIESGRALVNISTVGTSAIVAPNGSNLDGLRPFTADAMIADVPLITGTTPALRYGAVIAGFWMTLGTAGIAASAVVRLRRSAAPATV